MIVPDGFDNFINTPDNDDVKQIPGNVIIHKIERDKQPTETDIEFNTRLIQKYQDEIKDLLYDTFNKKVYKIDTDKYNQIKNKNLGFDSNMVIGIIPDDTMNKIYNEIENSIGSLTDKPQCTFFSSHLVEHNQYDENTIKIVQVRKYSQIPKNVIKFSIFIDPYSISDPNYVEIHIFVYSAITFMSGSVQKPNFQVTNIVTDQLGQYTQQLDMNNGQQYLLIPPLSVVNFLDLWNRFNQQYYFVTPIQNAIYRERKGFLFSKTYHDLYINVFNEVAKYYHFQKLYD